MSDPAQWQQSNAQQLTAALAALRLRLDAHVERIRPVTEPTPPPVVPSPRPARTVGRSVLQRLLAGPTTDPAPAPATPAAPTPPISLPTIDPAVLPPAPPPELPSALTLLTQRLGLSRFERDLLLLCAGMELDTRIAGLCARAQDDPQKPFPTFALALALFDEPVWDVLSPERPLRYFRLIEVHATPTQPLTASPLRADERIVSYLKGLDYLDERLSALCTPLVFDPGAELSSSQEQAVRDLVHRLQLNGPPARLPVIQLLGHDGASKQLVARQTAAQLNRSLFRLPVELLPAAPADLDSLARLWQRESLLLPLALYLDGQELDASAGERVEALARFITRTDGVIFLAVREPISRPETAGAALIDVARPTPAEQQAVWSEALGSAAAGIAEQLAGQFSLNLGNIRLLAEQAQALGGSGTEGTADAAWDLCCAQERPRLDALAQRLEPKVTWDDIVLPAAELGVLHQLAAQVRQRRRVYGEWGFGRKMSRGLSISALFAGASGTGKTMAAEVLASDLRLNLYRIDLSAVVSKYIGETEKNLRRLFDAAEDGGAILFFDEADALFGKRSEVKDSHDRYANIEVNYLLQRIESYRGLAILATNMRSALDGAFLRRLRFIVNFPFPSVADRRRLWEKVFPVSDPVRGLGGVPVENLDHARLARLSLTGGHIHNVALNASFLAAQAGSVVTMPLVLQAARAEFQKLNRPINEAEFRPTPAQAGRPTASVVA